MKCSDGQDSQSHLYECAKLQNTNAISNNNMIGYEEIYGNNVQNQLYITRVIFSAYKSRCEYMSSSGKIQ